MRGPAEALFRAALFILGAVIALNIAITYLRPILAWLIVGVVLAITTWSILMIRRLRRDHW